MVAVQFITCSAAKSLKINPGAQNKIVELKYKLFAGGEPDKYFLFKFVKLDVISPQFTTVRIQVMQDIESNKSYKGS